MEQELIIEAAAEAIRQAEGLLIGAGAGMGVDSGLPDFRGNDGFWRAYPPFRKLGLSFSDLANPKWFHSDPQLAWGFYGHRMHLYRDTNPHQGFQLLREWGEQMPLGSFVFTSNVDGQFQKAGFPADRVLECHGSLHHLQCLNTCKDAIWPAHDIAVNIDAEACRAEGELPRCRFCRSLARPNILMFGDFGWLHWRTETQHDAFDLWLEKLLKGRFVVIECGAGRAIPTVRRTCEMSVHRAPEGQGTLIRINPRESQGPQGTLSLAQGALDALEAIAAQL